MNKKLFLFSILFLVTALNGLAQNPKQETPSPRSNIRYNGQPLANLTRGPYLQVVTSNSIIIRWRTDTWARTRVRYGTSPEQLNLTADDSSLVLDHEVKLTDLRPRTRYYYSIGGIRDTLQGDMNNYFVTLPLPGTEALYRIGAFGDCGNNSTNQRNVRDQVIKYLGDDYMDAWILLGDNAYRDGEDAQYQVNFFNIYKDNLLKKYPLYPAPGNHDYHDVEFSQAYAQRSHHVAYYKNFSMPVNGEAGGVPSHNPAFYSFDIGNIHFLSLDSYGMEEQSFRMSDTLGPQVQWIKKDLEANKNKGWVIAYFHHPPYTMGSHNSDKESELVKIRENFIRILERYGVDLVLAGHSHLYERSKFIAGHFGAMDSFDSTKHLVSTSTGFYDGSRNSCPYIKSDNNGTVYVVAGSAGQLTFTQKTYPHKAMVYSDVTVGGAPIIEVNANRLDLKWVATDGKVRDKFTMMKKVNKKTTIQMQKGDSTALTASFIGNYKWKNRKDTTRTILVSPPVGKSTFVVRDEFSCVEDKFEVIVSRR
ncbi:MAG: purple acid phosphatase family protein [Chitinophagaceae bacterium]